ncbi:MAG: ABC transporter ATP-binding protein, partial [Oscillospiraceae bacterium]|nr:ABC transporter ATP-binding protein [Oscillospiraceae bacterium]
MEEKGKPQSPIAWVLGQTGDHGGQYVLSVILAIVGVAFSLAPYFVVIGIVQGLMDGQKNFSFYLTRCLIMAALWLARVLFHALSTATSHKATFAVLGEIRKRCMEKLTRMPLGTVLEQSSGALKNTLIERIDSIETTLAHIVPEFTANLLIPVNILIYIFTIDWRMGLASLATVPLGMFCYVFMMAGSAKFYEHTVTAT